MKKVLSLLLALACLLSLAACGGSGEKTAADEAKEVVKGFMDAYVNLDAEGVAKYVDNAEKFAELAEKLDVDKVVDNLMASNPEAQAYVGYIKPLLEKLLDKMRSAMSYKIKGVKEEEGDYIVTVEVTMMADDASDLFDISDLVSQEEITNIAMELISDGTITAETSQEEIVEILLKKVFGRIEEHIDSYEFNMQTKEGELVVVSKDGKMIIDSEKSKLN